jgi:hypothetical protein
MSEPENLKTLLLRKRDGARLQPQKPPLLLKMQRELLMPRQQEEAQKLLARTENSFNLKIRTEVLFDLLSKRREREDLS